MLSSIYLSIQAEEFSEKRKLYDEGVRFGCWGMSMYSLSCSFYSFLLGRYPLSILYLSHYIVLENVLVFLILVFLFILIGQVSIFYPLSIHYLSSIYPLSILYQSHYIVLGNVHVFLILLLLFILTGQVSIIYPLSIHYLSFNYPLSILYQSHYIVLENVHVFLILLFLFILIGQVSIIYPLSIYYIVSLYVFFIFLSLFILTGLVSIIYPLSIIYQSHYIVLSLSMYSLSCSFYSFLLGRYPLSIHYLPTIYLILSHSMYSTYLKDSNVLFIMIFLFFLAGQVFIIYPLSIYYLVSMFSFFFILQIMNFKQMIEL